MRAESASSVYRRLLKSADLLLNSFRWFADAVNSLAAVTIAAKEWREEVGEAVLARMSKDKLHLQRCADATCPFKQPHRHLTMLAHSLSLMSRGSLKAACLDRTDLDAHKRAACAQEVDARIQKVQLCPACACQCMVLQFWH